MPDITTPGYFRIGFVVLDIPPTDIATNRVNNDDQMAALRGSTPMFVKSGQARWDVTIRWKALRLLNPDGSFDHSQWDNLRTIVAMFKAAPFVEVENAFLRQHFTTVQDQYQTQRMAFALKQMRVDTNPDTTNVLDVVLTMTLFNYAPYSKDFGYVGIQSGNPVDAPSSTSFQSFITGWMAHNMDATPAEFNAPPIAPWQAQEEGTISLKWRKYVYTPFKSPQPQAHQSQPTATTVPAQAQPVAPPSPKVSVTGKSKLHLPASVKTLIQAACAKYGVDPNVAEAQCQFESGGNQAAISPTGAVGLFQLLPSTAKGLHVDPFDAAQNVDGGVRYLSIQLQKFGNYPHALGAYNAGAGYIIAYRDGRSLKNGKHSPINPTGLKTLDGLPPKGIPANENVPAYVKTILTNAGRTDLLTNVPPQSIDHTPPITVTQVTPIASQNSNYLDGINSAMAALPLLPDGGQWFLDHYTELGAFFYAEQKTTLASVDSVAGGDFDMFPNQVSVVMVNNLPMIPLAAMQYPTYQHVGPTDTIITIGMNSVGDNNGVLPEAEHPGIQSLSQMVSTLEDQFHNLRTTFRAVSSIHRMQAVFMENQVLNMLGIRGTLVRGLNTETVPDTSNLAQVTLMASQYENVFEETTPYQINGVSSSYKPVLKTILTSGALNKLSKNELDTLQTTKAFADAWTKRDETFLLNEILSISKEPRLNFLSSTTDTPGTNIWFKERDNLFGNLDIELKLFNDQGDASFISTEPPIHNSLPGLQLRRLELDGKQGQITYADYFVFSQLPNQVDAAANTALRARIEAQFATQKPAILDDMYQRLFDWELRTNPIFSREATSITNSPFFKDKFTNAVPAQGPSSQDVNQGHGCYKDLGLVDYRQNPADYFVNYNEILMQDIRGDIQNIFGKSNQTAQDVNQTQTINGPSNDHAGLTFTANAQGLPGDANALVRMTNVGAYSMATAFPTYKLMLIEEDNSGLFFAFDNFYSYASVMDIEIIKYRDKPDTAIIQISNLAHLLQHRMYDDTAAGKMERAADRFNVDPTGGLTSTGEVGTGGNPIGGITAGKTAGGTPYQLGQNLRKNLVEGRGENYSRVPLKFFALQTGSKIQVRMGFTNNPDLLYPVFTGQVTQIDGDDILTLTCQSFMLELMSTPGTTVKANSRLGMNFLSGGAAFGGWSLSSAGDSANVMQTMLRSPAARHFGHWQIGQVTDSKIKGFSWIDLPGASFAGSSNDTISKIGHLLQTGFDRSGENILVNSAINIDATKKADDTVNSARRTFDNENPNWFLGTARYGIDKQSKRSIWDIVKDIGRRYPHFNLMVRGYGFPYESDATLVYAHPLDWYYSRPKLLGDSEKERPNNGTQGQTFNDWWTKVGKGKWDILWQEAIPKPGFNIAKQLSAGVTASITEALFEAQTTLTDMAGSGPEGFEFAVTYLHGILTGADTGQGIPVLYRLAAHIEQMGNLGLGFFKNVDASFQALYREWISYLILSDPAANSSRLMPVRRYHLVDYNHIIHNGLSVNDQIYNAVKIKDREPFKFNQNIPDQHVRVLDVTEMIEDVDNNVLHGIGEPLINAYSQSFLREEVGRMYQGEIIIRGMPEIEPFDVILLNDMSTGMIGPVEVDTVIHSFNLENGFITIIKPRLLVVANESVSVGIIQALGLAWSNASANLHDLKQVFNPFDPNSTLAAKGLEVGAVAGTLLAAAAAFAWAPPLGITLAALGLLAGYGLLTFVENRQKDNAFAIMPLSRFGRPWLGGLQGFAISDFAYSLNTTLKWFDAEEISPTIESWNDLIHWRSDYIPEQ